MKKIIFLLIIPLFSLYSAEREYEAGNNSWQLEKKVNLQELADSKNSISLSIREDEYIPDKRTILLMHFNEVEEYDSTGRCKVTNLSVSDKVKKLGRGSGVFNAGGKALILDTQGKSFFPEKIYSGDFTFDFWLLSRNAADGENYFLYENYTDAGGKVLPQLFRSYLEDRRITWEIKNLFLPFDKEAFSLVLKGKKRIIPGTWSHHLLRYSSDTGMLEYLYNGVPEAVAYVNREGRETGHTYPFYAGESSIIEIGKNFTGAVDEFRIQGEWIENVCLSSIGHFSGTFITDLIDLKHSKSEIFNIDFKDTVPPGTDIKYYYHISDSPVSPVLDSAVWKEILSENQRISGGRFFFIKGILYSDGSKNISPEVNWIKIRYDEKSPPPPPSVVRAEVLENKLKLRWSKVPDSDIDGYLVYIGEKPGKYFCPDDESICSPVDAGLKNSILIDNLVNGKIYYIAVSSYYKTASPVGNIIKKGGNFSSEISARPSADSR